MPNRIKNLLVWNERLDPAETVVSISVVPERFDSDTQVRGKLVGPRCPYSTTVEVAYPLRQNERGTTSIATRVIIPEASFWEPESPFLYQGTLELWEKGECCDKVSITHGLTQIKLDRDRLVINGRPFTIRGMTCQSASEEDARQWHQAGINTLLVPVMEEAERVEIPGNNHNVRAFVWRPTHPWALKQETKNLWDLGDRFGFLMLGWIRGYIDSEKGGEIAFSWGRHVSALGWVLRHDLSELKALYILGQEIGGIYHGAEVTQPLTEPPHETGYPPPYGISFLVCRESLLPSLGEIKVPKIVLVEESGIAAGKEKEILSQPGILGWIRTG